MLIFLSYTSFELLYEVKVVDITGKQHSVFWDKQIY